MAIELVLRFTSETKFGYNTKTANVVLCTQLERHQKATQRVAWVKAAQALYQTHKPQLAEKLAWLELANRYMAADRISPYVHPARPKYMLHKEASGYYHKWTIDLEQEMVLMTDEMLRQRNGRRRFPHH